MIAFSPSTLYVLVWLIVSGYLLWKFVTILLAPLRSTLRDLPGPPNPSIIYGNLLEIQNAEDATLHEAWTEKYGPTITYTGWMNVSLVFRTYCHDR